MSETLGKMVSAIYGLLLLLAIYLFFVDFKYLIGFTVLSVVLYGLEKYEVVSVGPHSVLVRYFLAAAAFILVPTALIVIFVVK